MGALLPDHSHCLNCDDPIDEGERFCSSECEENFNKDEKKEKGRFTLFIIIAAVGMILITLLAVL